MALPQASLQLPRRNRLASDGGVPEIAARIQFANARFYRLLDYCADALGESVRATEELSQRVSALRKGIESHASDGGRQQEEKRS
jgi:hypothetical protein